MKFTLKCTPYKSLVPFNALTPYGCDCTLVILANLNLDLAYAIPSTKYVSFDDTSQSGTADNAFAPICIGDTVSPLL